MATKKPFLVSGTILSLSYWKYQWVVLSPKCVKLFWLLCVSLSSHAIQALKPHMSHVEHWNEGLFMFINQASLFLNTDAVDFQNMCLKWYGNSFLLHRNKCLENKHRHDTQESELLKFRCDLVSIVHTCKNGKEKPENCSSLQVKFKIGPSTVHFGRFVCTKAHTLWNRKRKNGFGLTLAYQTHSCWPQCPLCRIL